MARFLLQPCTFRETRLVSQKGVEPVPCDWNGLLELFVPSSGTDPHRYKQQVGKLRLLQPGAFVGLVVSRYTNRVTTFMLLNQDRSNRFGWLLKDDPQLPGRMQSVYRVLEVDWEQLPVEESRV